jgi:hypothetical protein
VKTTWLTAVHVVSLLTIAGASLAEGVYGAAFVAIPVQMIAALAAVVLVLWRGRLTIGVIVAGWLALGPFVMPFVPDNLSSGKPGLVASTVVYLVAIAVALASGALALVVHRRSTPTRLLTESRR